MANRRRAPGDIHVRAMSAVVLVPLVLGVCWLGGTLFAAVVIGAAAIVWSEWRAMSGPHAGWTLAGGAYSLAMAVALIGLRYDAEFGLVAILWLLGVVWATDTGAYVVGRALGGPRLWRRVSPNKTWAGFFGGVACGGVIGYLILWANGSEGVAPIWLSVVTAMTVMGGDLFESALKRKFAAKESGALIPGHGGLMDRVDGLIAAAVFAIFVGGVRAGSFAHAASGIVVWP